MHNGGSGPSLCAHVSKQCDTIDASTDVVDQFTHDELGNERIGRRKLGGCRIGPRMETSVLATVRFATMAFKHRHLHVLQGRERGHK